MTPLFLPEIFVFILFFSILLLFSHRNVINTPTHLMWIFKIISCFVFTFTSLDIMHVFKIGSWQEKLQRLSQTFVFSQTELGACLIAADIHKKKIERQRLYNDQLEGLPCSRSWGHHRAGSSHSSYCWDTRWWSSWVHQSRRHSHRCGHTAESRSGTCRCGTWRLTRYTSSLKSQTSGSLHVCPVSAFQDASHNSKSTLCKCSW